MYKGLGCRRSQGIWPRGHHDEQRRIETRTSVLNTSEAQYEKVMAVNLKSAFFGTNSRRNR